MVVDFQGNGIWSAFEYFTVPTESPHSFTRRYHPTEKNKTYLEILEEQMTPTFIYANSTMDILYHVSCIAV